jgi:hypothetical protein
MLRSAKAIIAIAAMIGLVTSIVLLFYSALSGFV